MAGVAAALARVVPEAYPDEEQGAAWLAAIKGGVTESLFSADPVIQSSCEAKEAGTRREARPALRTGPARRLSARCAAAHSAALSIPPAVSGNPPPTAASSAPPCPGPTAPRRSKQPAAGGPGPQAPPAARAAAR
jgi:hypothetical protein